MMGRCPKFTKLGKSSHGPAGEQAPHHPKNFRGCQHPSASPAGSPRVLLGHRGVKSFWEQAFAQHQIYFGGRPMHLDRGGVSPGFAVASIWISRGSCPGSRATSMKAFISSPSLPSCSSTWAASPMPSRSGACLGMLRTTTRSSPRKGGHFGSGTASRDGTGWDGKGQDGMGWVSNPLCHANL